MGEPTTWLHEIGQQAKRDCAKLGAHSVLVEALLAVVMKHKLLDDFIAASESLSGAGKRFEELESKIAALEIERERNHETIARLRRQLDAVTPTQTTEAQ